MLIKNVQVKGLTLHTENFGDPSAPACLLIAGAMAPARLWTDSFCKQLVAKGLFVIRYDHRDIGESSGVDWQKAPYTLQDLAKDAMGILDAYGIKKAHFIGHSMGGYVCEWIALDFPECILTMTAISAGPIGATTETDLPFTPAEKVIYEKTWKILRERKDGPTLDATIQNFLPVWQHLNGRFPLDKEIAIRYTQDLLTRTRHPIRMGNNHEQVVQAVKGTYTDTTIWYIIGGILLIAIGAGFALLRRGR